MGESELSKVNSNAVFFFSTFWKKKETMNSFMIYQTKRNSIALYIDFLMLTTHLVLDI